MPTIAAKNASKKKLVWPAQKAVESALLLSIGLLGGQVTFGSQKGQILAALADHFGISQKQRRLPHRCARTKWSNKVQWARVGLIQGGKLERNCRRGNWVLSEAGRLAWLELAARWVQDDPDQIRGRIVGFLSEILPEDPGEKRSAS